MPSGFLAAGLLWPSHAVVHPMNRTFPRRLQHARVPVREAFARQGHRPRAGRRPAWFRLLQRRGYRRDLVHRSSGRSGSARGLRRAYKRWAIEQLPIIPERWRVEPKAATAAQFKIVKQLVGQASELVIATDADREGEMIAREIIELCGYRGPIQRLWLSALNDASIRKALGALKPSAETLPLYYSALARSRADWLIGMNLSRLLRLLGRQAGYTGVLSVGRVQTPTLKLVVDRDREIAASSPCRSGPSRSRCPMPANPSSQVGRRRRVVRTTPAAACSSRWPSRPPNACAPPAAPRWCRSRRSACAKVRRCRSTWARCRRCVPSSWAWTCRRRWTSPRRCMRRTRRRPIRAPTRATCPRACWPRCRPFSTAWSRPIPACAR
jgi:hypothetical protein